MVEPFPEAKYLFLTIQREILEAPDLSLVLGNCHVKSV